MCGHRGNASISCHINNTDVKQDGLSVGAAGPALFCLTSCLSTVCPPSCIGSHFLSNYRDDKAFALVSEVEQSSPPKTSKMWLGLGLLIAMIATQVCHAFPLQPQRVAS